MNQRATVPSLSLICILTLAAGATAMAAEPAAQVERELPGLLAIYKQLHAAPELSRQEVRTSAFLAGEMRKLGFEVHEQVGRYDDAQPQAYGVVAVLKNGAGPTVLVRTDMDALPIAEQTGLPFASTVHVRNPAGEEVPAMHACGHDLHMTVWLGTAKQLALQKDRWRGTLIMIGQPAEEIGAGAQAMLTDQVYERFGRPDFAVALHDEGKIPAGQVAFTPGYALASMTGVDIVVRGVGSHGAHPEAGKDPIVLSAQIINALQTIVSREMLPLDPAVVTVGTIHGGTKRNIIPDEVRMSLTVRAYKDEVREHIIASIKRIVMNTARAAGVPEDRMPSAEVVEGPIRSTYNDPQLTARVGKALQRVLGERNAYEIPPVMVTEDFGYFGLDRQIPTTLFWLGAGDPQKLEAAKRAGTEPPSLHSPYFAPLAEPAIRTGVTAMTGVVVDLLKAR